MPNESKTPFNDLPLLPPKEDLESRAVLKRCISANKALAELKGAGNLIPNQSMLINAIPLQEAKLSSEIENIVTTQDELFLAAMESKESADPRTKEVLRYRTALKVGSETIQEEPFSAALFAEICSTLRGEITTVRDKESVMIGNRTTGEVIYTPPRGHEILMKKLANLAEFMNQDSELDPLTRMAVAHYQFEAIHPFTDGNGRTGRILNILFLLHEELLNIPVLYLSRFIIENKSEYYKRLRGVTERGEWESWVLYMLEGVETTANWTTGRIQAIRDLFEETLEKCRQELPTKVYSKELVEMIFVQPYCKIKFLVDADIAKRQTASVYLQELEKIGVLEGEKSGREVIYKNPRLISVLTA